MDEAETDLFLKWLAGETEIGYNRTGRGPKKPRKDPEHEQQVALFQWIDGKAIEHEELGYAYATPNGGKRDRCTGQKLKAEGVRPGIPDIFLPVARKGYHGLYIEMKVRYEDGSKNYPSEEQYDRIDQLTRQGYLVVVCYTWVEAAKVIALYLGYEDLLEGL